MSNTMPLLLLLCMLLLLPEGKAEVISLPDAPKVVQPSVVSTNHLPQVSAPQAQTKQPPAKVRILTYDLESLPDPNDPIAMIASGVNTSYRKPAGLISSVSPEYNIDSNILSLQRVQDNRRKRAIMFVFLMNPDKKEKEATSSARMHVIGSKKVFTEQQVIDDEIPLDVSVSKYQDGYAEGKWNLVLPSKKPREIMASLVWSF